MASEKSRRAGDVYACAEAKQTKRLVRFWAKVELAARGIERGNRIFYRVVRLADPWALEECGSPREAVEWACFFLLDRGKARG